MSNIIIIIMSLLLISCSEETDHSSNKNEQANNQTELSQKEQVANNKNLDNDATRAQEEQSEKITLIKDTSQENIQITDRFHEDEDKFDEKWDKIVDADSQKDATIPSTEEPKEDNVDTNSNEIGNEIAPDNNASNQENNNVTTNNTINELVKQEEPYLPSYKVSKNDIVLGNAKAHVVMIEYFSPTCPHCAYYHKTVLPVLKQKYLDTNKIAYVIREFIGNKQDLDAAILERCGGDVASFLNFQIVLLEQQDKWAVTNKYRELLTNIAKIGGISAESYEKCLNDNKIVETLLANTNFAANAPNFVGTPVFFVNGLQITDGYSAENISKIIDKALENDKSLGNPDKK